MGAIGKEGADPVTLASDTASPRPSDGQRDYTTFHAVTDASEAAYQARIWIAENPDAWAFMVRRALADAEAERRISLYHLCELVRMKDFARADGQPMKINNRIRPGLARIMAHDYPQTAPFIETRRAACDGMV